MFNIYKNIYKTMSYKKIFLFWVFIFLSFIFLILSLKSLTKKYLLVIPIFGGEINEGVIDIPLYLNPVLAKNEVEKDINSLIYSSLFKKDINGDYIQDIVEDNILSEDKKTLNLKIKENIKFQDGKPLNADDVIFTFTKIKDKELSSNLNIYLEDINIEKVDDFNLKIEMKKPYFFIKESLSFGILPKHIWEKYNNQEFILSEKNLNPIGSGPYKIDEILKKNNISKEYRLITFNKYFKEKPFLKNINFKVYENENDLFLALQKGQIDSTNYLNENYFSKLKNKNIASSNLSNIFSLAFNINKNKNLSNKNFRNAIAYSIDRTEISKNIFYDYVNPNPLNDSIIFDKNISKDYLVKTFSKTESKKIKDPKTKKISTISNSTISPEINNLELSISTLDIGNLKEVAENIAKQIQNNLNIKVNVLVYNQNDFSNILKERNYEILLFWIYFRKRYRYLCFFTFFSKKLSRSKYFWIFKQ